MSSTSKRLNWVDHARGIAIIFVVYRHVVIGMKRSGMYVGELMYNFQEVVYNFRMPVFFILSGIFISNSLLRKSPLYILRQRFSNLLYPYLLWGTLTIILQLLFSRYANSQKVWTDIFKIILQPRSVDHLWYLLALFNVSIIYLFFLRLKIPEGLHIVFTVFLYIISKTSYFEGNSFFSDAFYFYIFLHIGASVSKYFLSNDAANQLLAPKNIFFVLPFFLAGQYFWFQNKLFELQYSIPFLFINLIACYFVFLISNFISFRSGTGWLAYLGKNSIYIYLMHVFISSILRNILLWLFPEINSAVCLVICFPFCLIVPVILYKAFMKKGFYWIFTFDKPATKNISFKS